MYQKVLVGVDGRASGRDAIALASQMLDRDGEMTLVHVVVAGAKPPHMVPAGLEEADRATARELLEKERAETGVDGAIVVVDAPTPGAGLHSEAERRASDLIVVGSCHRGLFGRALLGSDTRAALNGSPCAVAVAPVAYADHAQPFSSIGVGYDGSPESESALAIARALAARTHARIRALRVVGLPAYSYPGAAVWVGPAIDELLKAAGAEMAALPGVDGQARYGFAGEELAAFSQEVDLLIVGAREYGPVGRLMHGSTSGYLQQHARAPLLVIARGVPAASPEVDAAQGHAQLPATV